MTEAAAAPTTALLGVWTPWAQVLCGPCEYAGFKANPTLAANHTKRLQALTPKVRTAEIEQPDGLLLGRCTECRCPCWVRDDVALLQRVGFVTSDLDWVGPLGWALQQTGGMCAALVFSAAGHEIVVTAMDGAFYIGEYASQEWDEPLRAWQSEPFYTDGTLKAVPALSKLATECARQVIEFVRAPAATLADATAVTL